MSDFKYTKSFEELNAKVRELEQSLTQLTSVISAANQATEEGSVANKKKAKSISDEAVEEKKSAAQKKELKKLEKQLSDLKAKSAALSTEKGKLLSEEIRAQKRLAASKREEINLDKELARLQGSKQSADNLERRNLDVKREKVRLLNQEYRKSVTAQAQAEAGLKSKGQALAGYNRRLGVTSQMLNQVRGMLLATFGAYAVIRGMSNVINTIRDFEQSMARVRAISNATQEEFEQLSDAAKNISSRGSIFDPKTIADLQVELAKLGFAAGEIVVATKPIVDLATATGEELARSAEIAAATLRAFNLDASAMGATIDVMAKAFTTSALDMSRWAEGAKYAAPVASQLGWNVEQLAAVMGVLANRQIFGSLAGTSLRNIMIEMSDKASDLSKGLGLTSTDFGEFIDRLEEANEKGLDFARIIELVPRRATTAALLIAKNTKEIREMEIAMNAASGAVAEMANIQMATLTGELRQLSSAWKAFILELDEGDSIMSEAFKNFTSYIREQIRLLTLAQKFGGSISTFLLDALDAIRDEQFERYKNAVAGVSESIRGLRGEERALATQELYFEKAIELIPDIVKYNNTISESADQSAVLETKLATLNAAFSDLINNSTTAVRGFSTDLLEKEYGRVEEIIIDLNEKIDKLSDDNEGQSFSLSWYDENGKKQTEYFDSGEDERRKEREDLEKTLEAYGLYFKKLDDELGKRAESKRGDKARKEEYERLKKHLAAMRQLEIDEANARPDLTDQEREFALENIRARYDRELLLLEARYEEDAELKRIYQKRAEIGLELHEANMQAIREKWNLSDVRARKKANDAVLRDQKRVNSLEEELLKIKIDRLRKQLAAIDKDDTTEIRIRTQEIFDLEYEQDLLKAENRVSELNNQIQFLETEIAKIPEGLSDEEIDAWYEKLGISDEGLKEMKDQLGIAMIILKDLIEDGSQQLKPEKKTLADLLGIDLKDWNAIISATSAISNALRGAADAAVDAANRKVEASNRAVAELQRDLETELRLAEQGFASNVTLKQQQLAEEKKIRDQNIKEQEKAQKAQLALQSVLDAANMVSTVINIALHTTKTKGLAGILATAVGAASLFALIASIRAKSKAIAETKYEKGGWEVLKGRSHRAGGVSLGDGREAEGGEMLAVFNKKATSKYGKDLGRFIDDVNKGSLKFKPTSINKNSEKINEFTKVINKERIELDTKSVLKASTPQNVIVNFDDRKMVEMNRTLKQIRDNSTFFADGFKIIKTGNRIRKVKV